MDPEDLAAAISRQVRLTRARRVLSQREPLVVGAGPDGGESAEPLGAAVTELDAYRDLAGRRFPAHRRVEPFRLTTYW